MQSIKTRIKRKEIHTQVFRMAGLARAALDFNIMIQPKLIFTV